MKIQKFLSKIPPFAETTPSRRARREQMRHIYFYKSYTDTKLDIQILFLYMKAVTAAYNILVMSVPS